MKQLDKLKSEEQRSVSEGNSADFHFSN